MTVQTKTFDQLVTDQVTAAQASAAQATPPKVLDFSIGSALRAIVEGFGSAVGLFLQGLALAVLQLTRFATSYGADADSWGADFSFTRLPGVASTGQVTFARFTPTLQALVPVGAQIVSADGTQPFTVTADTTNSAYSPSQNGYVIASGVSSISVPVQAANAVAASNVVAGALSQIVTPISGVDTVTNAAPFTNGADPESDAAMKIRFVAFIASLSRATKTAVGFAIASIKQGLVYTITENADYPGTTADNGNFFVIVDDGTGSPPSLLLSQVATAIDAYRPLCGRFTVNGPTKVTPAIVMTVTVAAGFDKPTVGGLVSAAVVAFVNGLPLGTTTLPWSRLSQVAYDASPGVSNVTGVTLNGGTTDLALTAIQVARITGANVTVNTP